MTRLGHRRPKAARRAWILPLAAAAIAAAAAFGLSTAALADRNALWTIVHDRCVPNEEAHKDPAPCAAVVLGQDEGQGEAQGYAILKDRVGATQFLLIPTRKISGIESPEALAPDVPNYWLAAWQARRFVEERAKRPLAWDMIGLAINSVRGRTQDQMHIHIDCIRADVRAALAEHAHAIGPQWAQLPFDLRGRRYLARRLDAGELATQDPFKLLAKALASSGGDTAADMADESLVMIGLANGDNRQSFVLLADRGAPDKGLFAHGEDLLDHGCAVAGEP